MVCTFCGEYIVWFTASDHVTYTDYLEEGLLRDNCGKKYVVFRWATLEVHYYRLYEGTKLMWVTCSSCREKMDAKQERYERYVMGF